VTLGIYGPAFYLLDKIYVNRRFEINKGVAVLTLGVSVYDRPVPGESSFSIRPLGESVGIKLLCDLLRGATFS